MKGTIKLFPNNSKTIVGSIVKWNNQYYTVNTISDNTINGNIPSSEAILHKYHVVNRNFIGELEYGDYDKVQESDVVNYTSRDILNKMELNDKVSIDKLNLASKTYFNFYKNATRKLTGIITQINGRYATVNMYNSNEDMLIKRHMITLVGKNIKHICKLI